ncbi:MAG: helix-turn-helix domain-containing protein [Candidatus Magasanikbacteria bacterium]|jgi:sugar-specific transcriptional regulator TrmB
MLIKDLQSIGFTKNLSEVYLSLAQLGGQAKAGEIIKKTGLHRNIVYICLDKLIEKQLLTKTEERGVTIYKTLDPARLMNEIREKEQLTTNIIEEIEALKKHPDTQEIIVHEGLEGFRNFNLYTLKKIEEGGTLQVLGSIGDKWFEYMGEEKYKEYIKIQNKKKIKWEMITYFDSKRDKQFINDYPELCEVKLLPQTYDNPASIYIFGDTISINIFTEPFSVIEIKNRAVADVYRNYFSLLWNQEVFTYRGWDAIDKILCANLEDGFTYDVFGATYGVGTKEEQDRVLEFFMENHRKTAHFKPNRRLIFFEQDREQAAKEVSPLDADTRKNVRLRFLSDKYFSPMETHLFKDKVILIFSFGEPIATVYTNPKIIEVYKKQFELWWGMSVE